MTRVLAAGLVLALAASAAADEPRKPRAIIYYDADGGVTRQELDTRGKGRIDFWVHYERGEMTRQVEDTVGDGRPHLWSYFEGGRLVRQESDTKERGTPDTWFELDGDGRVRRKAMDTTGAGRPDLVAHYEAGRLVRERVAGKPSIGQLHGVPPAPLPHRITDQDAERRGVLEQERAPGLGDPILEAGRVTDREALEEAGHLRRRRQDRLLGHPAAELLGVALDRLRQLDQPAVALHQLAQTGPELLERLPQRGARLVLGGLAPEQGGQGLAGMGMRLQDQVCQERQRLGARLGDGRGTARHQ